jgi:hypothetical protein
MLKTLIRATLSSVLAYWRTRPAIHYTLDEAKRETRGSRIKQKLNEVYPF